MKSGEVRTKYLNFFKARGHTEIPSAPLVPENDPTTLFTSSGMQPLIPYLLGQPHPAGYRLVDSQKSFRSQDIDEVGDNRHTTFFEMLGNWSLGDYFKKEQLPWIYEFITKELGLSKERLYVSVFEGTETIPKDIESAEIWKKLGIPDDRIYFYGVKKNWWSRSGEPDKMPAGEPGGPDSEVFYDFGKSLGLHEKSPYKRDTCHPNCDCGRFLEIANSVFMQYQKQADGSLKELPKKNVDFGGGLERLTAATENTPDIFNTDLFDPMIRIIGSLSNKTYGENQEKTRAMRIIADHIKAAVMMMADGVLPSNKTQGYVLRRLIRRAMLYGKSLGLTGDFTYVKKLVLPVAQIYEDSYPAVVEKSGEIELILAEEAMRFGKTLERGMTEFERLNADQMHELSAFNLFQSYGFPYEMTEELFSKRGIKLNKKKFLDIYEAHQELSRTAAKGMFKGGLADHTRETTRLHTAHHLLLAALQTIVDPAIKQRGSNITAERLRMDFNLARKITPEELQKVTELVNETIKMNLPVSRVEMLREDAEKIGAQMEFGHKYPDRVSVYFVGPQNNFFSSEFCGGPHVSFTGELGRFKIIKEESVGSAVRRIYATLSPYGIAKNNRKISASRNPS